MSRPENSVATQTIAIQKTEKIYFQEDLVAKNINIPSGQSHVFWIKPNSGKKIEYLAMGMFLPNAQMYSGASSGMVSILIYDAIDDEYGNEKYSIEIARSTWNFDVDVTISSNVPLNHTAAHPSQLEIWSRNVERLNASKKGTIKIEIVNSTDVELNFSGYPYGGNFVMMLEETEVV